MVWRGWQARLREVMLVAAAAAGCQSSAASPGAVEADRAPALTDGQKCLDAARGVPEPKRDMPLKIEVSQILVRHRELEDPRGATRTAEQACLRALEALKALQAGLDWSEGVKQFSDSPSSELGRVARDDLAPGFAETAFSLDVNQLSYVVESSRGFHVILRTH